jgi:hypothetical protein
MFAMGSLPVSSAENGGVASTSSPRLTNLPFLMWNSTSALVAANVTPLSLNQAGFGRRWMITGCAVKIKNQAQISSMPLE